MIQSGAGSYPWPPHPGEPVPSVPPRRRTRIFEGGPGGYFLLVSGRRPRRGGSESSSVGRGLRVPSKAAGPPGYGGLRAASCTHQVILVHVHLADMIEVRKIFRVLLGFAFIISENCISFNVQ